MLELFGWARGWPKMNIVELGTRAGNSTSAFLAACEVHRRGHVWSFDIRPADVPDCYRESEYWTFTQCDAMSEEALKEGPPEIDTLFVDLEHTFEETLTVCTLWIPRVRPGGVALFHDTEYPQINGEWKSPHESEVGRALDVYCRMKGLEWVNVPGCFGLGILRIR